MVFQGLEGIKNDNDALTSVVGMNPPITLAIGSVGGN